ncbi:NAD(P)-binding protein [Coniophora puteana RWD-64-598 SS2]|uniref:NAD(P)-binding protein n=1 Tax=Coniophora puteana (strain RWD-64-598) TaxID=741705 RepID=A0A5M3MA68_CONPW|nr:NAD(P)-binding protein [Coniophora puteana RWD-64-598 SS2]EIW75541.1 NAD(P)-binding protein [Coniophora puteana RWD-64-598 SS2]
MLPVNTGVALVTGCAQGIGRAVATRLASDGFHLALTDLPGKQGHVEDLVHELSKRRSDIRTHVALGDVSVENTVRNSIKDVVVTAAAICPVNLLCDRAWLGPGILTMSAGSTCFNFVITTEKQWDNIFSVNTKGTFFYYKHVGKQMIKQGRGGRIIGMSSITGKRGVISRFLNLEMNSLKNLQLAWIYSIGLPFIGPYSASKYAVRGLTQAAASEFGKYGITVNACAPGSIETQLLRDAGVALEKLLTEESPAGLADVIDPSHAPLGRLGQPEDIAGLVSYLASADSSFMTVNAAQRSSDLSKIHDLRRKKVLSLADSSSKQESQKKKLR